jgi:hypothetical protein
VRPGGPAVACDFPLSAIRRGDLTDATYQPDETIWTAENRGSPLVDFVDHHRSTYPQAGAACALRLSLAVTCLVNQCLTPDLVDGGPSAVDHPPGSGPTGVAATLAARRAGQRTFAAVPVGLLGLPWSSVDGPARTGARDPAGGSFLIGEEGLSYLCSRRRRAPVGRARSRSASGAAGVRALVAARTARLSGRLELRTESLHKVDHGSIVERVRLHVVTDHKGGEFLRSDVVETSPSPGSPAEIRV